MKKILDLFVKNDKYAPQWQKKPFSIGDFSFATDAHMLIKCPKVNEVSELNGYSHKDLLSVIPTQRDFSKAIDVALLTKLVKDLPLVPFCDECSECNGDGEVEWSYKGHTADFDCPKCDGSGEQDGSRTERDKKLYVKIGVCLFAIHKFANLLNAMHLCKTTELKLVHQILPKSPSIFAFADYEVLLMPITPESEEVTEERILATIEL